MARDQNKDQNRGSSGQRGDEDAGLQEELNREANEGGDSVGDVGSNRNLSGSSTWETLPGQGQRGDESGQQDNKGKR